MNFTVSVNYTDGKNMTFKFSLWTEVSSFLSRLESRRDIKNWTITSSDYTY